MVVWHAESSVGSVPACDQHKRPAPPDIEEGPWSSVEENPPRSTDEPEWNPWPAPVDWIQRGHVEGVEKIGPKVPVPFGKVHLNNYESNQERLEIVIRSHVKGWRQVWDDQEEDSSEESAGREEPPTKGKEKSLVDRPLQNRDPNSRDPVIVHNVVPSLDALGLVKVSEVQAVHHHGIVIPLELSVHGGVSSLFIGGKVVLAELDVAFSELGALVECNVSVWSHEECHGCTGATIVAHVELKLSLSGTATAFAIHLCRHAHGFQVCAFANIWCVSLVHGQ